MADLNAIREINARSSDSKAGLEALGDAIEKLDLLAAEAMTIAQTQRNPEIRLLGLRTARNALMANVRIMLSSGLAPRAHARMITGTTIA
jgi:hypothetical protein